MYNPYHCRIFPFSNFLKSDYSYMNQPSVQWQPMGYASALQRVFALMVDGIVFLPLNLLAQHNLLVLKNFPLVVLMAVAWWVYKPFMEWRYGATLGKMVVKIRVLDSRMQNISFNQALLRFMPYFAISLSQLLFHFNLFHAVGFEEATTLEGIQAVVEMLGVSSAPLFTYFIYLFLVTPVVYDEKQQAIYDKWSQTYCIAVQPVLDEGPTTSDPFEPSKPTDNDLLDD